MDEFIGTDILKVETKNLVNYLLKIRIILVAPEKYNVIGLKQGF